MWYVIPEMTASNGPLVASRDWTIENRRQFIGSASEAIQDATRRYKEQRTIGVGGS